MHRASQGTRYAATPLEAVYYGDGSLDALPEELSRMECERILILTTGSLADSPVLNLVTDLARSAASHVSVLPDVSAHLPFNTVDYLVGKAYELQVEAVVSLGGGSVTDAGKAVRAALGVGARKAKDLHHSDWPTRNPVYVPQIAIPTTLSAAEYNGAFAMTHDGVKEGYLDIALSPAVVVLDDRAAATTPDWLWASTGVRALDHCMETFISRSPTPPTDAAAIHGAKILFRDLPDSLGEDARPGTRVSCLVGAWLSFFGVHNAMVGLSHGIGHQLGARYKTPHGVTSCIILPVVMRRLAERNPARTADLARELNIASAGSVDDLAAKELAEHVATFVTSLGVPGRLRDLGIDRDGFASLADNALKHTTARFAPFPVTHDDIVEILEEAW